MLQQTNSESVKKPRPVQPIFVQCCHSEAPSFALVLGIDHGGDGALVDRILTLRSTRGKSVNAAAVSLKHKRQDQVCVDICCVTIGLVKHATKRFDTVAMVSTVSVTEISTA